MFFWVVRRSDCTALLVTSPHCALMLPASTSSDLAGNSGKAAIQTFSNASAMTATVTATATAITTESPQHSVGFYFGSSGERQCEFVY